MSKRLEELFNIAPQPDEVNQNDEPADTDELREMIHAADVAIDKIDIALPTVRNLETSDKELDDLADLATDTFNDLISLSMNVEPRFSGPIIQSASNMLGHALTARMAKIDRRLKTVDLQLKKARLDQMNAKSQQAEEESIEGKGTVIDRNELLREILAQSKKQ